LGDVKQVRITGGGAHKYAKLIEERMGASVVKLDEMSMLVDGLNFFLRNNVYDEVFT
jgi:pantothenate kinase